MFCFVLFCFNIYIILQHLSGVKDDKLVGTQAKIGTLVHDHVWHRFGWCEAKYNDWIAPSMFELYNNLNFFNFYECITDDLIDGDTIYPFKSIATNANSFTILDKRLCITNWQCKNQKNVNALKSVEIVRKIAHLQAQDIQKLKKKVNKLQSDLISKEEEINNKQQEIDSIKFKFKVRKHPKK